MYYIEPCLVIPDIVTVNRIITREQNSRCEQTSRCEQNSPRYSGDYPVHQGLFCSRVASLLVESVDTAT